MCIRDRLKTALHAAAGSVVATRAARDRAPFRMPLDRAFTVAGSGTVVTGSIASGAVRVGDELRIEPGGVSVRVRGLQNHDQPAAVLRAGQRGAVNLSGVHHQELARGQELAAPGYLRPSTRITAYVQSLPSAPPLKSRHNCLHCAKAAYCRPASAVEPKILTKPWRRSWNNFT